MHRKLSVLFLIGIGILAALLYFVDFDKVFAMLWSIPIEYLILLFIVQLSTMLLAALKWRIILKHSNVSMRNLIPTIFTGYLINNITPVGLAGGEPVKAYILSKTEKIPITTAASSVIADLFIEIFPLFILSATAIILVFMMGIPIELGIALGVIALALLIVFIIALSAVLHKEISGKIVCLVVAIISRVPVLRRKSPKLKSEVDTISSKFNQAMRKHMLDRDILVFATLISMTVWVLRILRLWLAFKALGVEVPIHYALIVETTTSVISFFPAIPGAVGIWEGTSVAIFMALGIPKAIATAGTILSRIFFYLLPSFIGVLAALSLGIGIRGILDVPGAMNRKVARQKAKQQPGRQ
ncbi:MAG: flippase-like domain-containing protein [Candidatus Altiarchaeales archaeon]|nr:flippase-like domain-containing protein [Candidatus Altiarchaeales archaeon]